MSDDKYEMAMDYLKDEADRKEDEEERRKDDEELILKLFQKNIELEKLTLKLFQRIIELKDKLKILELGLKDETLKEIK